MKILDCTLRDGGYYTNWDFDSQVVDSYINAMNALPVSSIEIGYRSTPTQEYLGKFGYTPTSIIYTIRTQFKKQLAVMLNEKSSRIEDLTSLLGTLVGIVDIVRLAVDPANFDRAVKLAEAVKKMGFIVSFNMMYMSTWNKIEGLYKKLKKLEGIADLLCMVDSYGGITPNEVKRIIASIHDNANIPLGFHGHNNLQLALANTMAAIECGITNVDATILGMGRGAGNLKLELLLTYLNKHKSLGVDFNTLGDVIMAFEPLLEQYRWGTNLPYMLSGANAIPQKVVMEWACNRVYSFNTIVNTLDAKRNPNKRPHRYPILQRVAKYKRVLIVGGGPSAQMHLEAIKEFMIARPDIAIVFATARYADCYLDLPNDHYYCLAGDESRRFMKTVGDKSSKYICVIPPYPSEIGTDVPECIAGKTFELSQIDFIEHFKDSVTTLALQLAKDISDGNIYLIGYDGYKGKTLSEKERVLAAENQSIFASFRLATGRVLTSLAPSLYSSLDSKSVYQFLD